MKARTALSVAPLLMVFLCIPLHTVQATTTPTTHSAHALVSVQKKEVALTFDDGPYGTSTEEILAILKKEQVPATFFLIGKNVDEYPAIAKEIALDGYTIGNHTYTHPTNLPSLTRSQIENELHKTDLAIASSTGVHTKLFRPPYGRISKRLRHIVQADGYKIVLWNVDPVDWNYASSSSALIEQRIETQKKTEMTIVMHDGRDTQVNYPRENLVNALPTVITDLKKQGYTFVTADTLSI